jgi:hypothetical protein
MKTNYSLFYTLAAAILVSATSWSQITVAQWNFNGPTATTVPGGTSSPTPSVGSGTALFVGGTTATTPLTDFPSGAASGGSSDPTPVTTPNTNFAWGSTNYAAIGTESRLRGVQFNVSTAGYQGITFKFDQRLSNTANNTYVVQYTTDRTVDTPVWIDAQTFTFTPAVAGTGDVWYNQRSVDLTLFTNVNNNPNVAFRIVSAFDPTVGNYTAATSTATYAVTGTSRYDMVTVLADTSLGLPGHNVADNTFSISPNPSNHEVVNFSQAHDIEVYDVAGKVVYSAKNVSSVDTKAFTSGVYIIKTENGMTRKLIVK